ncbi:MAG: SelL-related redox protein [Kiritimatiellae bacterium]|nr:SelL-related redox protein [Kiritimatiellia bacterium]MDW8458064.1 SelL-related redox protein [Verrucomicrobiota bacterium]
MTTQLHPRLGLPEILPASVQLLMAHVGDPQRHSLLEMTASKPTLIAFLRHLGCVFCRQMLGDIRDARQFLEQSGLQIALVHMASDRQAELVFKLYGLDDLPRFSDPDRSLYEAFGLRRVTVRELLSADLFRRGLEACIHDRHFMGIPRGDPMQMPGVFVVDRGYIRAKFIHQHPWDRPDLRALAREALAAPVSV